MFRACVTRYMYPKTRIACAEYRTYFDPYSLLPKCKEGILLI